MSDPYADALGISTDQNNPGNLKPGGKFASYSTPEEGLAAMDANLKAYGGKGINTLSGVISRWAPPSENNTNAYIADVSSRLGLDPNQQIDLSNPLVRHAISTGIMLHENGPKSVFASKPQAMPQPVQASQAADPYAEAMASYTPAPEAKKAEPYSEMDAQAAMGGTILHGASALAGAAVGGWRGIGTLLKTGSLKEMVKTIHDTEDALTYNPDAQSDAGQLTAASESKYSPLTWPAQAGHFVGDVVNQTGNPYLAPVAAVADVGTQLAIPYGLAKAAKLPLGRTAEDSPRVEPTMESPAPAGAPAAPLANNPSPTLPVAPDFRLNFSEPGKFAESAPDVPGGLPKDVQAQRAAILQKIGLGDQVRQSAVTGDAQSAATDFQTSRVDSPAGRAMRSQLDSEKQALTNYSDGITERTGGSILNDQAAKLGRGETVLAPMESLKNWFDTQTRALYQVADSRAQGVPTDLNGFRSVLGDDSLLTNSDRVQLRSAIGAYAKKLGIIGDDGQIFANGQQAETLRKYLNENWSPQNSGLVGKLKDALDDDVTSSAGEDVYAAARQMRAQRAQTIDNPDGISRLLDASGPNGVNRKVPVERVSDTITTMPVAQLQHIVDTLKVVPEELQPQAQAALSEIKAQFAHNVRDIGSKQAGQWNARGVQAYLRANSARMQAVFSPEEMQQFGTLNDAGNILAKDQSYPGAAVQGHNLVRSGLMGAVQHGATTTGAAVGGPIGAVVGNVVGSRLAGKIDQAAELRAVQKRFTKLSDLIQNQ